MSLSKLVVPDLMEPVIGHRIWMVGPDYKIYGAGFGLTVCWEPYETLISHHSEKYPWGNFPIPIVNHLRLAQMCKGIESCTHCGIHAWKDIDCQSPTGRRADVCHSISFNRTLSDGFYRSHGKRPLGIVKGTVNLWGTVVVHALGYRAERAYPKTFDTLLVGVGVDLVRLRNAYGLKGE